MALLEAAAPEAFRREIRLLLLTAMAVFVFTVAVGILNGTDLVDFDQKTILTHVHAGTLGWLTLAAFAATLWLFSSGKPPSPAMAGAGRALASASVVAIPAYALAFLLTYGTWRPVLGIVALALISGFFAWTVARSRSIEMTTPHLALLAALGTSVLGGIFGVLWGFQLATGDRFLPEDAEGAHPGTMVVGFLIPLGMALSEWCLAWPRPARLGRAGAAQVGFPFVGGLVLALGLLLDIIPLVILSLPFEVIGVAVYVVRLWPRLMDIEWHLRTRARHAAMSVGWTVVNIGLFFYLIGRYEGDFDLVPVGEILALDHAMFVGVVTNAVFALLLAATEDSADILSWADDVVLWGTNLALAGFVIGLFAGENVFKQIFTPIMGPSILLGLGVCALRLNPQVWRSRQAPKSRSAV